MNEKFAVFVIVCADRTEYLYVDVYLEIYIYMSNVYLCMSLTMQCGVCVLRTYVMWHTHTSTCILCIIMILIYA